jgi:hypothetical protein
MPDWVKDLLREGATAVVSGMIPSTTKWWSKLLPFINTQVPAELSLVGTLLAVVLGLFVCVESQRRPATPQDPIFARRLAGVGIIVAIIGLFVMLLMTSDLVTFGPRVDVFVNKVGYILFVVFLGAPIGYYIGRVGV